MASRLAELTATVEDMIANQVELEQAYCPKCELEPTMTFGAETIGAFVLTACCGLLVGTDVTPLDMLALLRRTKKPFIVGIVCQFFCMPFYAYLSSLVLKSLMVEHAYHSMEAMSLGLTLVGSVPGGATSNIFTLFCGGNVPLSLALTFVSTTTALGMIPLVIYVCYTLRFQADDAPSVPFSDIIIPLAVMVGCVVVGMMMKLFARPVTVWYIQKIASVLSVAILLGAVAIGIATKPHLLAFDPAVYWVMLTVQPMGYLFGWILGKFSGCTLRDRLTISFETGVQNMALGMVMASLAFNQETEACQFSPECMKFINEDHYYLGSKYEYALFGNGRFKEGPGVGKVSHLGFTPGAAGARELGGCCKYNELVWMDVWRPSAACALAFAIHAIWMTMFFRYLFPNGFARLKHDGCDEELWENCPVRSPCVQADANGVLEPTCPADGSFAAAKTMPPSTFAELLEKAAERMPKEFALLGCDWSLRNSLLVYRSELPGNRQCKQWTWNDYRNDVQKIAAAFVALGLEDNGSVAISGNSSPAWHLTALSALVAGAKVAGLEQDSIHVWSDIVRHCAASIVVVKDNSHIDLLKPFLDDLPEIKCIVVYDDDPQIETIARCDKLTPVTVVAWDSLSQRAGEQHVLEVQKRRAGSNPGKPAFLVYSDVSAGAAPKAAMLSHDNLIVQAHAFLHLHRNKFGIDPVEERILSYLPQNGAAFIFDFVLPLVLTATTQSFATCYYARSLDVEKGLLEQRMLIVKPTLFVASPQIWDSLADFVALAEKQSAIRAWAKKQARRHVATKSAAGSKDKPFGFSLARGLVLSKMDASLGLDCCKVLLSLSPLRLQTLEFFATYGLIVTECYGTPESSFITTISSETRFLWGSCGFAVPGCQLKVFKRTSCSGEVKKLTCQQVKDDQNLEDVVEEAQHNYICVRGRHVMMGYLGSKCDSAAVIDDQGWLNLSVCGSVGQDGFVHIEHDTNCNSDALDTRL